MLSDSFQAKEPFSKLAGLKICDSQNSIEMIQMIKFFPFKQNSKKCQLIRLNQIKSARTDESIQTNEPTFCVFFRISMNQLIHLNQHKGVGLSCVSYSNEPWRNELYK